MRRFLRTVALVILGGAIIALSVANRHNVRLILDPLIDRDQALSIEVPLFMLFYIALFTGLVIGALTMWLLQARWRRTAKLAGREAVIWKREAENLKRGISAEAIGGQNTPISAHG